MIPESIQSLVRAAHQAPSADNSQPWRLIWDGETLSVAYDEPRIRGKSFGPYQPATLIAIGGCIENIGQLAASAGASFELRFPADSRPDADHYVRLRLSRASSLQSPEDHPLFRRHTNRFRYREEPIPRAILDPASRLSEGSARLLVIDDKLRIAGCASLVRRASEIRFQTREVHEWLGRSLRFTPEEVEKTGDGLDVSTLDLPPGGGLLLKLIADWKRMALLNRVGIYRLLSAIDAQPVARAPAVLAIISPRDRRSVVDAGRLITRAWISLNAQGVAVHPYYVVADQLHRLATDKIPGQLIGQARTIAGQAHELLELADDESLQMLLRIGYPMRDPVRSRRLPIEKVLRGPSA